MHLFVANKNLLTYLLVTFVCIYFVSQICVNLTRDTFLVSPEKKRWQSLCIFLKPRCIIVPYFEWTWWYASIYLICVLCSFDSGLFQKDFVKLKLNLRRQSYIFCVLRNSYRMAHCHIRSQPDNKLGINYLQLKFITNLNE